MALIKCPECGKDISDQAELCVGCGFPIKKVLSVKPDVAPVAEPIVKPSAETIAKPEPPKAEVIKKQSVDYLGGVKEFFRRNKWKIRKILRIVLIITLIVSLIFALWYFGEADFVKDLAKKEVLETWQEVSKDIELEKIEYKKIKFELADKDQIEDIVDKIADPSVRFTDINGITYSSQYEYWDEKNYDPYNDIWRIYTVEGRYTVKDTYDTYRGDFKVVYVVGFIDKCWCTYKTEIEVPKQLREYMS